MKRTINLDQFDVLPMDFSEMQGIGGGGLLEFVKDYVIGKALDWYVAGVVREMDNPVHGNPQDWDVVGFK